MYILFFTAMFLNFLLTLADDLNSSQLQRRDNLPDADCESSKSNLGQGICLDKNYSKGDPPNKTRMEVFIAVDRFIVREVYDDRKTVSFDFVLSLNWSDPRIIVNFSDSENEKDIRNNWASRMIWKPDINMRRLTDRKAMEESIDIKKYSLTSNLMDSRASINVQLMFGGRVTMYCYFKLDMYPLDTQNCPGKFYGQGTTELIFVVKRFGNPKHKRYNDLTKNYIGVGFDISTKMINDTFNNNFQISLELKRLIQPFLFKYYLPTTIIVIIAGLGFMFPLSILPGRVTLGVTLFLTLTNLFIHQMVRK